MMKRAQFHWLGLAFIALTASRLDAADAPYPHSPAVKGLTWETNIVRVGVNTGDNWPATWGDDDVLYTSWGDGGGFTHRDPKLSLGFAKIAGNPSGELRADEIPSSLDTVMGGGAKGIKSSALLTVDRKLYMFVRNVIIDGEFTHSRIAWSDDREKTWKWSDWHFAESFGCPEFVQFGKNYSGARDNYIYIVSQDNNNPYKYSEDVVLARVPKSRILDRNSWQFFTGRDTNGAQWSSNVNERRPMFSDRNGAQRVALTYNAGLKRYFLVTSIGTHGKDTKLMHTGGLGIFDAPEPWGPWTTVYYDQYWSGGNNLDYKLEEWTYHQKFPTKYMSDDGKAMWLLFSGRGENYTFCLRKAILDVAGNAAKTKR